jgi:ribosomal protein S27AE
MIMNTTTIGYTNTPNPTAFIAKNKQRLKQYDKTVYLNDGDEFEIELFNPTQNTISSEIKINDKSITQTGGLIIRPGQRVFLERYIDTNNKFVFKTYDVNGNSSEVLSAIESNGIISISFYRESTMNYGNTSILLNNYHYTNPYITTNPYTVLCSTTTNTTSVDMVNCSYTSMETGRVEKGNTSNQSITHNNNFNFEWFPFHTVAWKILPNSVKPIEVADLKKYCPNCGSKIKKSTHKFCPNCGHKLD